MKSYVPPAADDEEEPEEPSPKKRKAAKEDEAKEEPKAKAKAKARKLHTLCLLCAHVSTCVYYTILYTIPPTAN